MHYKINQSTSITKVGRLSFTHLCPPPKSKNIESRVWRRYQSHPAQLHLQFLPIYVLVHNNVKFLEFIRHVARIIQHSTSLVQACRYLATCDRQPQNKWHQTMFLANMRHMYTLLQTTTLLIKAKKLCTCWSCYRDYTCSRSFPHNVHNFNGLSP